MLKKITITGLFNQFDYEIELKSDGLTILTGPNGYGKTTILKILYAVAIKNLAFFFQFPFREIVLTLEDDKIRLSKITQETFDTQLPIPEFTRTQEQNEIKPSKTAQETLEIQWGSAKPVRYTIHEITDDLKRLLEDSAYRPIGDNHWVERNTGIRYTTESLLTFLIENNPEFQAKYLTNQMPDVGDVYLIKDQRLIRKIAANRRRNTPPYYFDDETRENFSNTIEEYARELSQIMRSVLANASKIGQELDSSFPRRLFDATTQVSADEFNQRYDAIKEKQKALRLYGLSATKEDSYPSFKEENAKALRVYLNDTEQKLAVFDDLLQKLNIFARILNDRQFVFKHLEISPDFGFRFTTAHDQELTLTDLSSGEQQELVLLYELLFRVRPNTLVLIDEPEISLHVAWQKEVLNDLLEIINLQKITVITATHSPQIIGTHWDLVVDLWNLAEGHSR